MSESSQAIRLKLEASYRESYRRAGIAATDRDIENIVLSDLTMVDRARELGELNQPGTGAKPKVDLTRDRPNPVLEACRESGMRLTVVDEADAPVRDRFGFMHDDPTIVSERWGAAVARLEQILQRTARAATIAGTLQNTEFPKLAKDFAETWAFFMTRAKAPPPGIDHNPYRMLSDRDAARLFMRKVEDICDRSTGVLGPYWVK